ncbi:MAG: SulP family inorganic anion transporter, partial [Lachnospiraceae bacterium]
VVAYNMSGWRGFVKMLKSPKSDGAVLLVTFFLTVFFDLVIAIEVGMILACLLFMNRMSQETVVNGLHYTWEGKDPKNDPDAISLRVIPKHTEVFEIIGPMFFGAADKFFEISRRMNHHYKVVIIRMRSVPAMDVTACNTLQQICEQCKKKGITVVLSHVNPQPLSVIEKTGLIDLIGRENICANIDEALVQAKKIME